MDGIEIIEIKANKILKPFFPISVLSRDDVYVWLNTGTGRYMFCIYQYSVHNYTVALEHKLLPPSLIENLTESKS